MPAIGKAYAKVRTKLATKADRILVDTCRLIVDEAQYSNVPCEFRGGSSNLDGAPYRIRFAWGSPAEIEATAIIDAIEGRSEIVLQLVGPTDSSTALWQEWQATSGPGSGRVDVGL